MEDTGTHGVDDDWPYYQAIIDEEDWRAHRNVASGLLQNLKRI